jgi:hypothetical protein
VAASALELFECQLELGDLVAELLGRLAELHALKAGKLDAQRIDQDITGGDIGARGCQCGFQLDDAIRASLSGAERPASDTVNI